VANVHGVARGVGAQVGLVSHRAIDIGAKVCDLPTLLAQLYALGCDRLGGFTIPRWVVPVRSDSHYEFDGDRTLTVAVPVLAMA
jgi:hypothetical protein